MTDNAVDNVPEVKSRSSTTRWWFRPCAACCWPCCAATSALLGSNGGQVHHAKVVPGLLALEDGALESGSILFNGQGTAQSTRRKAVCAARPSHVMEGRCV